ncbi:MAG: hypothetical protein ACI9V0_003592 [Parasphingorhabdus sp.]|jgi:hypothetical protein
MRSKAVWMTLSSAILIEITVPVFPLAVFAPSNPMLLGSSRTLALPMKVSASKIARCKGSKGFVASFRLCFIKRLLSQMLGLTFQKNATIAYSHT